MRCEIGCSLSKATNVHLSQNVCYPSIIRSHSPYLRSSSSADGTVILYTLPEQASLSPASTPIQRTFRCHSSFSPVRRVCTIPTMPSTFLTCGEDGQVFQIDVRCSSESSVRCVGREKGHRRTLWGIAVNPLDNWEAALVGEFNAVLLLDIRMSSRDVLCAASFLIIPIDCLFFLIEISSCMPVLPQSVTLYASAATIPSIRCVLQS